MKKSLIAENIYIITYLSFLYLFMSNVEWLDNINDYS